MDENEEINYNELFGLEETPEDGAPEDPGEGTVEPEGDAGTEPEDAGEQGKPEAGAGVPGAGNATEPARGIPGPKGEPGPVGPGGEPDKAAMESVIRSLGIMDPYSGKTITTREEYDAYRDRIYQERRSFIREKTGMSDAEMDDFIRNLPEVRRANEEGAKARELMENERRRQAKERVDAEVRKIAAMDPDVKSIADLTAGESYPQLLELVKRGYALSDALKLANFDKLQGRAQAASRQAAINSGAGRAGFQATQAKGQGDDTVPVPKDVLELYRGINPGATDAEIRADYNRYLKNSKTK